MTHTPAPRGWLTPDLVAVVDQALVSGATFCSTVIIARAAGIGAFGTYAVFTTSLSLCLAIQTAGLLGPLMTTGIQPHDEEYGEFVADALARATVSAAVGAMCLAMVMRFATGSAGSPMLYTVAAAAWLFQDFARRMCFVVRQPQRALLSDIVSYGAQTAWLLALYRTGRLDLPRAVAAIAATSIAGSVVVWPIWRERTWSWRYSRDRLRTNAGEGGLLIGTAAAQWVTTGGAIIAGSLIWGPLLAAAMKASQNLMGICHLWFQGLENSVPATAAGLRRSTGADLPRYLTRMSLVWGGLTLAVTALIAFKRQALLTMVYGSSFAGSGDVLLVYALYYAAAFFTIPAGAGLRACGQTTQLFKYSAAGALVAVCWLALTVNTTPVIAILGIVAGKCVIAVGMTRRLAPLLRPPVNTIAVHEQPAA